MFQVYLKLGFDHISDLKGYDHMLFLLALCAVYSWSEWKRILVLITAFTIGHSLTLALSALNLIHFNKQLVEVLIPITILLTALKNLFLSKKEEKTWNPSYLLPLFFGLIHGMGFSSFFKSLLGNDADIILPLFAFNVGVEIGQVLVVAVIMLINFVVTKGIKVKQAQWSKGISVIAGVLAVYMIIERF
jgi:hypothetical protein